eukprot:4659709-Amphidinium_carterae.1
MTAQTTFVSRRSYIQLPLLIVAFVAFVIEVLEGNAGFLFKADTAGLATSLTQLQQHSGAVGHSSCEVAPLQETKN